MSRFPTLKYSPNIYYLMERTSAPGSERQPVSEAFHGVRGPDPSVLQSGGTPPTKKAADATAISLFIDGGGAARWDG